MEERKSRKDGLAKKAARLILASQLTSTSSESGSVSNNDNVSLTSSKCALEQSADGAEDGGLYGENLRVDVCFEGSKGEELSKGNKFVGSRQSQEFTESSFELVIPKYKHLVNSSELTRIPVSEARTNRSQSIVSGTLLGSDELDSCLPGRRLSIFVSTFNMAGKDILDHHIQEMLFPEHVQHTADIYAIGLQEAAPECSAKEFRVWEKRLQCCLSHCKQVLIRSVWMGVQHLSLFIRRELVWFVSDGPDILPRINDCNRIESFFRTRNMLPLHGSLLDDSDYVFWFGDMNFRLTIDDFMVENFNGLPPRTADIKVLMEKDQLINVLKEGKPLAKFEEHPIQFLPTYKFNFGENTYATQLRWFAYTDRVIYREKVNTNNDLHCISYDSVPAVCSSDHKPVYAFFEAMIVPESEE
ncbi:72 kDa inositol polyphosphate 5 phosphatase [Trichuris trichiura]|uniref:72 kDa inositol polyphosphate 5 phosphatase n=1 Tax=Trichuris trichiura TaxID=36087 RepID=A0A077ZCU6_TRITR|nr:72 kDa inositol polyphosphate 5 phosphatase [Trichuris trichiura]